MRPDLQDMVSQAAHFPHSYDFGRDGVSFAFVDEAELKAASFLDSRLGDPAAKTDWRPWGEVAAAVEAADLPERLGFIFHLGHVGSTLISRLIGESSQILSLREPSPLRTVAEQQTRLHLPQSELSQEGFARRLDVWMKLWSRGFTPGQTPVHKATSIASDCAHLFVTRPSAPPALFVIARFPAYLGGVLASVRARIDTRQHAAERLERLHRRLGETPWRLCDLSDGEIVAMGFVAELAAMGAAADARPDQVLWLDFDRFLDEPSPHLQAVFERFGASPAPELLRTVLAGPIMNSYSKSQKHAYSTAMRRNVAHIGQTGHPIEFARGLAWLEAARKRYPLIDAAAARAE